MVKGKLEGITEDEKSVDIAKNPLSQNIDFHTISLATGLKNDKTEKLKY